MPEGSRIRDGVDALASFLERHPAALVLTGAGLSTASGIPGYRDRDGVRRGRLPIQGPEFRRERAIQRRYWARSMVGWPLLARAAPNAGHLALASLQAEGRLGFILTQNVDGLHQQAGSHALLELHGNIHHVACLGCGARYARAFVQTQLEAANPAVLRAMAAPLPDGDAELDPDAIDDVAVPACVRCGGTLMPDVVFFGDSVPPARTSAALARMEAADALLVVGSSLMVYSGFRFCRLAQATGKPIAAVNLGRTRADDMLALKVETPAERILPLVAQQLKVNRLAPSLDVIDHEGTI